MLRGLEGEELTCRARDEDAVDERFEVLEVAAEAAVVDGPVLGEGRRERRQNLRMCHAIPLRRVVYR